MHNLYACLLKCFNIICLSSFVLRFLICTDNELNISEDSMTSSYRLQNITDVHIVACMQEASEYRRGFLMIKFTLHH